MGATHLAEQAARRHEQYQKAEIAFLKSQLANLEDRLRFVMARLNAVERNLGWPGN